MKKRNSLIFITITFVITAIIISGCGSIISDITGEKYDEENTELSYLKIFPAKIDMKVNQSKVFEIKAYNSENKLITMDIAKFEKWVAMYACAACGIVWDIYPITGSFQTKFTPHKIGRYTVSAKYDGIWVQSIVYVD